MSPYDHIRQAKALHAKALLEQQHVLGVGIGYKTHRGRQTDQLSMVVLVRHKLPPGALSPQALIPKALDDVPTDVIEVGDIRALGIGKAVGPAHWTARQRPVPAGASIGHYQITAGTLGCVAHDRRSGRRLIVSNNHVLANCNRARPGDPILQPGPADGGQVGVDTLAVLERFVPIRFPVSSWLGLVSRCAPSLASALQRSAGRAGSGWRSWPALPIRLGANYVDAAAARPLDEDDLLESTLEIGRVAGYRSAQLGQAVCKAGRTTAFTQGVVRVIDVSLQVAYTGQPSAVFEGQVVASPMSQGGDSGALIVGANDHQAVGLLFAGSAQATIFNPIAAVLEKLQVDLPGLPQAPAEALPAGQANRHIQAVRRIHQGALLSKTNVVGVGIGPQRRGGQRTGKLALVVMVTHKAPLDSLPAAERLPAQIDGIPVDVQELGWPGAAAPPAH